MENVVRDRVASWNRIDRVPLVAMEVLCEQLSIKIRLIDCLVIKNRSSKISLQKSSTVRPRRHFEGPT